MNKDTRLSDVLHVLLHMDQVDAPLTSEVLARSMGTNPAVFRRTMAGLREAGIVRSEKGHGGGWRLCRPLREITLLAVYQALGSPNLFSIGNRTRPSDCLIEKNVNAVMEGTMANATVLFARRFGEITLDQIAPSDPVSVELHADR
ncbi:transcriptional regulator [Aureimonas altamirensis]|uniref:Transcriptional regulator n=1 Tax=Aureimonas altamirensis TaxID=370622 RepID=A0A0B1Q2V8_9HYPH|nr:Rrf2 family transcriptional regulator [Aureimonas altamirensis]KHJ53711.1 transcriptional regulator [Aureimonas altamirensis]